MFAWLPWEWNVYHSIRTKFYKSTLKEKYVFLTNLTFNNELYGIKLYKILWHFMKIPTNKLGSKWNIQKAEMDV